LDSTNRAIDATNQPIPDELFFGRQTESTWLTERLDRDERLLVIYGPARIGKTALLRHLADTLAHRYVAVYLDAGKAGSWSAESPLLQIAGEIGRCVREQTAIRVEPPEAAPFTSDPLAAWETYLDILSAQLGGRQLVLLIDNLDRALMDAQDRGTANAVDPGAAWLRTLLHAPVQIILAVRHRDGLAQILPDPANPPPSFGLGTLDNAAAESLIKALVSLSSQIDPRATRRIVEITSHHPHYIQVFCRALLDCCAGKSPLTSSDVEETLSTLLEQPPPEFAATWQTLTAPEQLILSGFGALRGTRGAATQYDIQAFCEHHEFRLSLAEIIVALDRAVERDVLEKLGTNSYRFALELFRLWIQRHRPPEYVLRDSLWRSRSSRVAFQAASVRRALVRRPRFWMSVGVILLVAAAVALQPAFRGRRNDPRAAETGPASSTEPATPAQTAGPAPISTATPAPTPTMTLPRYDIACMARADESAPWQIYLLNSSTGERIRLTETDSNERTPRWSPDGRKLVFASDRDGNREIYVMDVAGASQGETAAALRNLSQHKAPDWQPAWSPDGARVAFSSYRDDNWELYLVDADGTNLLRMTDHPENDFSPTWSPDGSKLLFASRRYMDADLFVMDVTTGESTQLTTGELNEFDPAWSPDGRWIAYVTQHGDQGDVYVMRADGADPINLTDSPYANDFQPTWTPDGQWVVYVSYTAAEGDHELFRMRPDGSSVQRLTNDDYDDLAPSWRPPSR
jgi:Tol biopolymer transport system component